jgi:hypothetical protein
MVASGFSARTPLATGWNLWKVGVADPLAYAVGGHSLALYLLVLAAAGLVGIAGWIHARRYWEGMPPALDGVISALGALAVFGAFAAGARVGAMSGHPHAGRVFAVALTIVGWRMVRTWIGVRIAARKGRDGR